MLKSESVLLQECNPLGTSSIQFVLPNRKFSIAFIVESDSFNAMPWVKSFRGPWKIQFLFNEIHHLASLSWVSLEHISISENGMDDSLAKQGVDRSSNFSTYVM